MAESKDKYWLKGDKDEVVSYLSAYHEKWGLWATSPVRQAWVRNFLSYNSAMITPSDWNTSMVFEGEQGELLKFFTPKARSLVRQLMTLITKQRLSFQSQAQSSGQDIMEDVKLANALLDQIVDHQNLALKCEDLVEQAIVMGASFLKTTWRTDHGEPYDVYNGKVVYTGSVDISVVRVMDTFYDVNCHSWDQVDWVEVRTVKNRWDLIAQHPNLKSGLEDLEAAYEILGTNYWFDRSNATQNDDTVVIYEFYAKPSPALPKGRMVVYGDEHSVLYDGPNPYGFIPVEPMMPEKIAGTTLGYPKFTDMMPSNEMLDTCMSSVATNQSQFAVQSVMIPRGSNINVQDLNGMRFVSYTPQNAPGGGKPESLQLTQSPPEVFRFMDALEKHLGELSGVHPVLRGDTSGATSGSMVATLTANAIEFIDSISKNYHLCLEKTMHNAINCYKQFAKIPQPLTLTGKNNQVHGKDFTGEDLDHIRGVKIMVSNPLMQTIAGRMEIASQLQQMPEEMRYDYISLLEGHPLSEITDKYLSQNDLVWQENEAMKEGDHVPVLATDDHPYHIKTHSQLLNSPDIRKNSAKIAVILEHIETHLNMEKTTDPALMAMVRGQPVQDLGPGGPAPHDRMPSPKELTDEFVPPDEAQGIELENKIATPAKDELGRGG